MNKIIFVLLLFVWFYMSCNTKANNDKSTNEQIRNALSQLRQGLFSGGSEKDQLDSYFYNVVLALRFDLVQEAISRGADPNYCLGEFGWKDSNPLDVISWYPTYYRFEDEYVPNPTPDVEILNYLLVKGADINRRPYIWGIVFHSNNEYFKIIESQRRGNDKPFDDTSINKEKSQFVDDVNRLLKAFLEHGADPDKLGHPYPYSTEVALEKKITDQQANEYFSKGTRAINEAIEKGIKWESQVDLLLQYTSLDEESMRAAERSNDSAMIDKITKLWEVQKKND